MIRVPVLSLVVPLLLLVPGAGRDEEPGEEKAPIPAAAELAAAHAKVKERYAATLARAETNVESRRELAQTLLAVAERLGDAPADRYAVLLEAKELAIAGRDCQTGLDVVEKVCEWYALVDRDALRRELVLGIGPGLFPEEKPMVVDLGLDLIDECLGREDAANARPLLEAINRRARNAKVSEVVARLEAAKAALDELDAYLAAVEVLAKDPDDPKANQLVGWRLVFVKGELERGLKCLELAPDGPLKRCAVLDVAQPTEFVARMSVGDAWLEWSKSQRPAPREIARKRALHWYSLAQEIAKGLDREAADQKRKELEAPPSPLLAPGAEEADDELDEVAQAVSLALDWLVAHQSRDGSWDSDGFAQNCGKLGKSTCHGPGSPAHDVGITGLALLALGHAVDVKAYAGPIQKGLKWLASKQDRDGLLGPREGHDWIYDHAIATRAMAEVGMKVDRKAYKAPAQKALDQVFKARNSYGAWRYDLPPTGDNDTSVTGWMVFALAAAKGAGLAGDYKGAFEGALSFIDEVSDPDSGRVGYSAFGELSSRTPANEHFPREKGEAMTAVGLACRFLLGQEPGELSIMKKHGALLVTKLPDWDPEGFGSDFYYWYYGTVALRRMGEPGWTMWARALESALVENQCTGENADERGSWDPIDAWSFSGGRMYATALNCLSLHVLLGQRPSER